MKYCAAFALLLTAPLAGADGLRDPMRPPTPQTPSGPVHSEPLPAVTAVFISGDARKAIVDGRLVKAGDSVSDGKIEVVSADGVIWRRRGTAHELQLPRNLGNFKKPAAGPARTDHGAQ